MSVHYLYLHLRYNLAHVLHENVLVFSQSEVCIFFMYIVMFGQHNYYISGPDVWNRVCMLLVHLPPITHQFCFFFITSFMSMSMCQNPHEF